MKPRSLAASIVCAVLLAACTTPVPAGDSATSTEADRPGWRLVWADEFDIDGLPDAERWNYEEGFIRNQEAQYYTRQREENARVSDGFFSAASSNTSFSAADCRARRPSSASRTRISSRGTTRIK